MNGPDRAAQPLPREMADPTPFDEPWQAEAFALVVGLHEKGLFSWSEWAETLSGHLHGSDTAPDGSDYYARWLRALETLLSRHGVAGPERFDQLQAAWQRAARATPHGQPIRLENDPAGGEG